MIMPQELGGKGFSAAEAFQYKLNEFGSWDLQQPDQLYDGSCDCLMQQQVCREQLTCRHTVFKGSLER